MTPRRWFALARGGAVGLLLGGIVGGFLGAGCYELTTPHGQFGYEFEGFVQAATGAVLGMILGVVIGVWLAHPPRDR